MKVFIACLAIATSLMLNQTASAGPMRERITERAASIPQVNDLEQDDDAGASGKSFMPAGASLQRDIDYGADSLQRMDVYIPRNSHGASVIFMVHGGAWRIGDKASAGVAENKVARWLGKGMVFVSVNCRMLPKADPLTQADDVAMALVKAQTLAATWGADPSRFILMGHSAGAHLVAKATSIGVRSSVLAVDLSHKDINRDLGMPGPYTEGVESFMRSLGKE